MLVSKVHKYRNRNSMDYVSVSIEANLELKCEQGVYMTSNSLSCVLLWCPLTQKYEDACISSLSLE